MKSINFALLIALASATGPALAAASDVDPAYQPNKEFPTASNWMVRAAGLDDPKFRACYDAKLKARPAGSGAFDGIFEIMQACRAVAAAH